VLRIVPGDNEVILGEREELLADGLTAADVNWLLEAPGAAEIGWHKRSALGGPFPELPVKAVLECATH
jgi:hypothetical protein